MTYSLARSRFRIVGLLILFKLSDQGIDRRDRVRIEVGQSLHEIAPAFLGNKGARSALHGNHDVRTVKRGSLDKVDQAHGTAARFFLKGVSRQRRILFCRGVSAVVGADGVISRRSEMRSVRSRMRGCVAHRRPRR